MEYIFVAFLFSRIVYSVFRHVNESIVATRYLHGIYTLILYMGFSVFSYTPLPTYHTNGKLTNIASFLHPQAGPYKSHEKSLRQADAEILEKDDWDTFGGDDTVH